MSRTAVLAALAVALLCVLVPSSALAVAEKATLNASFSPDRLGTPTTITFGFHVATAEGTAPPPLTGLDLRCPPA